ncbi:hypothetical protein IW262DRAFT_1301962 [Armillaria fumosa]|nr:hypothetical protein IW262DRAFT_1301962 [Armillaria fumosa]
MQKEIKTMSTGCNSHPRKLMFGSARGLNEIDIMGHAIFINGINCPQDDNDDVPPPPVYSLGIASENGMKAEEKDVDDVQASVTAGGGAIRTRADDRGAHKCHACIPRSSPASLYSPPKPLDEISPLPVEILAAILSLISWTSVFALALLSHEFLSAAQAWIGPKHLDRVILCCHGMACCSTKC